MDSSLSHQETKAGDSYSSVFKRVSTFSINQKLGELEAREQTVLNNLPRLEQRYSADVAAQKQLQQLENIRSEISEVQKGRQSNLTKALGLANDRLINNFFIKWELAGDILGNSDNLYEARNIFDSVIEYQEKYKSTFDKYFEGVEAQLVSQPYHAWYGKITREQFDLTHTQQVLISNIFDPASTYELKRDSLKLARIFDSHSDGLIAAVLLGYIKASDERYEHILRNRKSNIENEVVNMESFSRLFMVESINDDNEEFKSITLDDGSVIQLPKYAEAGERIVHPTIEPGEIVVSYQRDFNGIRESSTKDQRMNSRYFKLTDEISCVPNASRVVSFQITNDDLNEFYSKKEQRIHSDNIQSLYYRLGLTSVEFIEKVVTWGDREDDESHPLMMSNFRGEYPSSAFVSDNLIMFDTHKISLMSNTPFLVIKNRFDGYGPGFMSPQPEDGKEHLGVHIYQRYRLLELSVLDENEH